MVEICREIANTEQQAGGGFYIILVNNFGAKHRMIKYMKLLRDIQLFSKINVKMKSNIFLVRVCTERLQWKKSPSNVRNQLHSVACN